MESFGRRRLGSAPTRLTVLAAALLSVAGALNGAPDFSRDVQPLFNAHCLACHGPKLQVHGLRLDQKASALKGGESGVPAIVPGKSEQSLLIRYVSATSEVVMPPSGPHLTAEEISLLRTWIDQGANWPEENSTNSGTQAKSSNHWAFQPITRPTVPSIKSAWIKNPIDAFVLAKLQQRHWRPAPPAAPWALRRRVYLDLTGLPPTLEEQEKHPANFDALVDDLLARPAYGERWARHWLDLVRYAETNGYERDATKPNAWRYRDYVINAFNSDKPFNRFVLEQLAGDELPNPTAETFTALTYYRLGPWDDEPADPETDRFDQRDDIVSTTSQVFLGLTLGCARCHNHKFEPLTARDYYSMLAIFNGLERPRNGRTEYDLPAGTWQQVEAATETDNRIHAYEKQVAEITKAVKPLTPEAKARIAEIQSRIDDSRRTAPKVERAYYLNEPKAEPPPTFLLIRGKASQPGPEVSPAVPEILGKQPLFPAPQRTSLRRLTFAQWLVDAENPLTARVIVNRVWQHHFGEGLVRTPSDFGVMGAKPTHPELLDWLTRWFMDNGWSIKKLHRLILTSNTYRMSKDWNAVYGAVDPEDRLLWRAPYQRLEVEAIRDSALAASGQLNTKMYGPSMFPHIPAAAMEGSSDPDKIWKESDEHEASRRTIYAFIKRSMVVPLLEVMDLCDSTRTAAKRQNTSVATQALTLFNGDFINHQAQHLANRLRDEAGSDPSRQINLAYRLVLARPPRPVETKAMIEFLKREPLEQMCRVMFNLNEFAYAD
jgi:hypothetical protein